MTFFSQVNWIAVIIGAVFSMVLGTLWYGPIFGKLWLKIVGKKEEDLQSSTIMYLLPLLATLIGMYVLGALIKGLEITLWWQGLIMGAVVWIGVGSTATLTTGTFEGSPRGAWALFTLYQLIVYSVMGVVFSIW